MVFGLIPEHGKRLFSCAALIDRVLRTRNHGQGFVTWVLHILEFLCMVEIDVSWPVIHAQLRFVQVCLLILVSM